MFIPKTNDWNNQELKRKSNKTNILETFMLNKLKMLLLKLYP